MRGHADARTRLQQHMGGEHTTVRAEQLRATGLSDRAVARRLGVPIDAIRQWFDLQDELVLSREDGAA